MLLHKVCSKGCRFISTPLLVLLTFSLFSSPVVFGITATATTTMEQDDHDRNRLALLDIKSNIRDDPDYILTTWNSSLQHCNWEGIKCGTRHGRVTVLDLSSRALSGSLSPAVSNLSFLQELLIGGNRLQGYLPPQLGLLSRLKILKATGNSFQGKIPPDISRCLNLEELWLDGNSFEGNIPSELDSLTHLADLALDKNKLTGDISVLGNLTSLTVLSISYNGFRGEIPASLGRLSHLTFLSLGGNFFTGLFPSSIYNLSSLTLLSIGCDLGGSSLHGTLPDDLGLRLPHLTTLQIMDTQIGGQIPTSISNLYNIVDINLTKNRFSGKIPINGSHLRNLTRLYLSQNNLGTREDGDLRFLNSLVNCSKLYFLSLAYNNLGGELPPSVAHLSTNLKKLELGGNWITGAIPSGLGNLVNLYELDLTNNEFTGRISDEINKLKKVRSIGLALNNFTGVIPPSFGNLSQLTRLDLGGNKLEGTIPSSLGNCTNLNYLDLDTNKLTGEIPPPFFGNLLQLTHLDLRGNKLEGTIPSSLGDCINLDYLDLHGNKLTGEIPAHLFHASKLSGGLFLQGNQLSGTLPQEIGRLQNLAMLDISNNNLSGKIPNSLSKCSSLTELYMGNNSFSGSIPRSMASLKGLYILDISNNNLSGQIPSYLSSFNLTNLNLSFNNLQGEVPMKGIFKNVSAVSLVGNARLCGGINQLHLPECQVTSGTDHPGKKFLLIILLVSMLSILLAVTMTLLLIRFCLKRKQQNVSTEALLGESLLPVSYNTLLKTTDGFSSRALIGMGSFGSVYKGVMNVDSKSIAIAVKVINLQHPGSAKSFMNECKALKSIRHRNLISIMSACSSIDFKRNDFKAIVYEYMPKGNLDEWLHLESPVTEDTSEQESRISIPQNLSLMQRISIAMDVANALDYLHSGCEIPIIHCDLKPSNILLDDDMVAHVSDFGLARLLPEIMNQNLSNSIGVLGTVGYAPPEYGLGNQISPPGDVYSYGIILLEMMTAKRPTHMMFQNGVSLHDYVKRAYLSNVIEVIDPKILEEVDRIDPESSSSRQGNKMECLLSVIKVGVGCSIESPLERMSIREAIKELKEAMEVLARSTQRV